MPTYEVRPFNKERFDECMAYLGTMHNKSLTQYDMVKLHVMADVYHILEYGKPIIGGPLSRWAHGPVVEPAYNRLRRWGYEWEADHTHQPESFYISAKEGQKFVFLPVAEVDETYFSKAELSSLAKAWDCVMSRKSWADSQDFFHKDSFIGRVWEAAGEDGRPIDWAAIVDAYKDAYPDYKNAEHIKALIAL
jgi:uncharacterized phage-associated protein